MEDQKLKDLVDLMDYVEAEMYKAVCIPGAWLAVPGGSITINCQTDFLIWRDTSIREQYNLVCNYLDSLDTRPWWAEKLQYND